MAPGETKISVAGVAEGKQLIGIPTGDDVCAEQRVKALLWGSMSQEMYQDLFGLRICCSALIEFTSMSEVLLHAGGSEATVT
ncbi:hypothetical protein BUE80_DR000108 [Diplocarpon rosae]|nr:hypothetical protein BUE80_DR000108 [Diplocarpon rosae]